MSGRCRRVMGRVLVGVGWSGAARLKRSQRPFPLATAHTGTPRGAHSLGAHAGEPTARGRLAGRSLLAVVACAALLAPMVLAPAAQSSKSKRIELNVWGGSDDTDSELLTELIKPKFEKQYKEYSIGYHAVGSGTAINRAIEKEDAPVEAERVNLILVNSPSLEKRFVEGGHDVPGSARPVWFNYFAVVGPSGDPAGVAGSDAHNAVGAFIKIYEAGRAGHAAFVSRDDESGANVKEQEIWRQAHEADPALGMHEVAAGRFIPWEGGHIPPWYHETGEAEGENLQTTNACAPTKGCYTLVDTGTYLWQSSHGETPNLEIVSQENSASAPGGTGELFNPFHVYLVKNAPNQAGAEDLLNLLVSKKFQEEVAAFPSASDPAFIPDAGPSAPTSEELRGELSGAAPDRHDCLHGDAVDCATGNLTESESDLQVPGLNGGLTFTRYYNSQAGAESSAPGPLGYGWSFEFGQTLSVDSETGAVTVTEANGATTTFTPAEGGGYEAPAWVQAKLATNSEGDYLYTLPDQRVLTFSDSGRLLRLTDRNANSTVLSYGSGGRLEAVTDPAGRKLTFAYDSEGLIESVTDPLGHTVKYAYSKGDLVSVTLPGQSSPRWRYAYKSNELTELIDGRGNATVNKYDSKHRVVKQTDPLGRVTEWKYKSEETLITEPSGAVEQIVFSGGQPISVTRDYGGAEASTKTYAYNLLGAVASETDGDGHTTRYEYDAEGNRTVRIDPDGDRTSWTYDSTHDVLSETTAKGETTTIERDAHGNAIEVSRPAPGAATQATKYKYDSHGDLESVEDPLKRTTTYEYDSDGQRTAEVDPEGDKRTWAYNEDGQEIACVSPRGHVSGAKESAYTTTIERDAQGRAVKVTDPLGHVTTYAYDADGNLESETDPAGNRTSYTYDADDERTKTTQPSGASSETEYNAEGKVSAQTDGNGHTTRYVRNVLGEVTEVLDPLGRKTSMEYDGAGNLIKLLDAAKRTTTYEYDPDNRLIAVSYSDGKTPPVKYEYDADGDLTKMTDGTGTSEYHYDQLDRLIESKDGHGDTLAYEYDLDDQPTKLTYPNGKSLTRAYDEDGRLQSVTDWLGHTTAFGYDADSNQTSIVFPSGTSEEDTYGYDEDDRMAQARMTKGSETLASIAYTRNADGAVTGESQTGLPGEAAIAYEYDTDGRLSKAASASYEYDAADNPTRLGSNTQSFNAGDQLEESGATTMTFNEVAERTETTPQSGPATSYGYDQAGDLTTITRPKEGETPAIEDSYGYDGNGLRTSQTISGSTSYLTWDQAESLPTLLSDGTNYYVYGPDNLPVEQITTREGKEQAQYLHHDQQGSTRLITGEKGETVGAYAYGAYGNQTGHTGTATTPLGYDAQYTSPDTGLIYLRNRVYDPTTAQFLSRDPLTPITDEPYSYAGDDPVNQSDPTGLISLGQIAEGIAAGTCIVASDGLCATAVGGAFVTSTATNTVNAISNNESVTEALEHEGVTVGETTLLGGAGLVKTALGVGGLLDGALPGSLVGNALINGVVTAPGATSIALEGQIDEAIFCE